MNCIFLLAEILQTYSSNHSAIVYERVIIPRAEIIFQKDPLTKSAISGEVIIGDMHLGVKGNNIFVLGSYPLCVVGRLAV
jgi:hypothetical protein